MRVYAICDDRWHPASVVRAGLDLLDEHVFEVVEDAGDWSAGTMAEYPVTLLAKSNNVSAEQHEPWMTPVIEDAFCSYVRGGRGLLVVHSGTAGYREAAVLRGLMGGAFERHPEQCPVTVKPHPSHPLTKGVIPFTETDEHYFMTVDDPRVKVFVTTSSEHGEQPGAWTRTESKGRVCVLTPGHNVEVWQHPSFQALLRNGLAWCAGAG